MRDYQYDVFGEVTGGSGTVESEFQFAGEQVDGSTGLQYLRNRYYDMETGRFISRDPVGAAPTWLEHPFQYASANPTNLTDPLGLWGCGWLSKLCDGVEQLANGVVGASKWVKDQLKGLSSATVQWISDVGWHAARAALNVELTAMALVYATVAGGSCSVRKDLIWICTSVGGFQRSTALTIGNVILTREKSVAEMRPGLIEHEMAHADQWAIARLTGGLGHQAIAGLLHIVNLAIDNALFGGRGCALLVEWVAEWQSGDRGGHCQ